MNLIDEFFLEANPNPERVGCPPEDIMKLIAEGKLRADHPARAHLATCSECFAEFQSFRLEASDAITKSGLQWSGSDFGSAESQESSRLRSAAVGPPPPPAPLMPARQDIALDYGAGPLGPPASPDMSFRLLDLSSGTESDLVLPLGMVDLKLILSTKHVPGAYRLFFSQGTNDLNAEFGTAAVLTKEDEQMMLRAFVDFRTFAIGVTSLTLVAALPETSEVYTILLVKEP